MPTSLLASGYRCVHIGMLSEAHKLSDGNTKLIAREETRAVTVQHLLQRKAVISHKTYLYD